MNAYVLGTVALVVAACSQPAAERASPPATSAASAPATVAENTAQAGRYELDKTHTSVTFRVDHLGMSRYTARFTRIDGELNFDPARPAAMTLQAQIDPRSITTDFPLDKPDFDAELAGPAWLDAGRFPQIVFKSTLIAPTGPDTANVTGDLTLHGVTKPVTLDVKFNGGYGPNEMDPGGSRIGFSAQGKLKRSEFGISAGIPAAGSRFGVGDDVDFAIETEFTRAKTGG